MPVSTPYFPAYPVAVRTTADGKEEAWDVIRKRWVRYTPEEAVRQHLVHWLVQERGFPPSLIAVEREIAFHALRKRFDVVVFDRAAKPHILCECKAPHIALTDEVVWQAGRYNAILQAPFLLLTNGVALHFIAADDITNEAPLA